MSALPKSTSSAPISEVNNPPLFSKLGAGALVLFLLLLLMVLQQVGVYVSARLLTGGIEAILSRSMSDEMRYSAEELIVWGSQNGTVMSLAFIFTLLMMTGCITLIAKWRIERHVLDVPYGVPQFLALKMFDWSVALKVFGLFIVYSIVAELGLNVLDKDASAFMDEMYATAEPRWLFVVAVVVVAPIYEELIFRGIMWRALRQHLTGQAGFWVTNIITSFLFVVIHVQYDLVELGILLIFALLLGYARERSESLLLPIGLHTFNNMMTMVLYLYFA